MNNVLYDACLLSQEDWIMSLQVDKDENHAFSKRHQKKMNALSDKMRSDKYHRLTRTAVRIIIVAAVILSIATTVIALPGPKKFLTSFYSDHMVISLEDADTVANNSKIAVKLPEGYTVAEEDYNEYYSTVTYKNGDNEIRIFRMSENTETAIDTAHTNIKTITENGIEYTVATNKDKTKKNKSVYWNYNSHIYCVISNLDESEIIEICKTVK